MSLEEKVLAHPEFFILDLEANKIIYKWVRGWDHKEKWSDPEEQVRAEWYLDLVTKYQYSPSDIGLEVEMPKRVPNQFADLVIYEQNVDAKYFVIEFKKADISDNEFEQAVKQGIGNGRVLNTLYFGTVAGETVRFFEWWKDEKIEDAFYAIPVRYGAPEEWTFTKWGVTDLEPVTMESLETALSKAHQTIWHGGKRNPAEAFGEVAKVIFVKVWDERKLRKNGEAYEFQRKRNETTEKLQKRIHAIYDEAKKKDPQVFSEDIKLDERELAAVVEHLQKLNLSKTDLDVKGEAFQKFLGNFFKGDFGQYFTPSTAVQFCVDMLGDELEDHHNILDTSCGSWGFLLRVLDHMRSKADAYFDKSSAEHFRFWHDFAEKKLYGIEISEAIARVAKMNMILHDDGHTNVISHDGLDSIEKMEKINREFKAGNFDFIFTNPPFGAVVKSTESDYLDSYELGMNGKKMRTTQKTEILFLERAWQFLKPSGQMAVVLPDGILTNSSLQYVRDYLLEHYELRAVVSLPQDAFRYYGAGVKSSILFLRKWEWKPKQDYPIFMAIAEKIGIDGTGRKCDNDLPGIVEQFHNFKKNPSAFE